MMPINPISLTLLILLAIIAAVIYLVFRVSRQYVLPLVKNRKSNRLFDLWIFRGELLAWALFIIFAIYQLFMTSPYVSLVLIVLIIIAGRAFWKDYIPGLLFRWENNAETGDRMRYGNGHCTIEDIGPRNLQLRNKDGETIILPYSHIVEAVISKSVQKSKLYQFTFRVTIENENPDTVSTLISRCIQECPWSIPSRQPTINSLGNGEYEIISFATDENAAGKQRMYIEGRIGDRVGN